MENTSPLANWLLKREPKIKYQVTEFSWIREVAPNWFDMGVEMGGHLGRGCGQDQEIALEKAIAEAVERATLIANGVPNSTGVAAHPNHSIALENAKAELIERISFRWHFANELPFVSFEPKSTEMKQAVDWLYLRNISLHFFSSCAPKGYFAVTAIAIGGPSFGAIFGLSARCDPRAAEIGAGFEVLRNVAYQFRANVAPLSLSEFQALNDPKSFDRFRLCLSQEYWDSVRVLFERSQNQIPVFPTVNFTEHDLLKNGDFTDAPLYVTQVRSDLPKQSFSFPLPIEEQ